MRYWQMSIYFKVWFLKFELYDTIYDSKHYNEDLKWVKTSFYTPCRLKVNVHSSYLLPKSINDKRFNFWHFFLRPNFANTQCRVEQYGRTWGWLSYSGWIFECLCSGSYPLGAFWHCRGRGDFPRWGWCLSLSLQGHVGQTDPNTCQSNRAIL